MYASVQEGLLLQQKTIRGSYQKSTFTKPDTRPALATGDLWKAKQLKEYRRANGMCYKCGEKFTPGHVCSQLPATGAHLKIVETMVQNEIISDALLDALVEQSTTDCATISVTALSGATHPKTIQLRPFVKQHTHPHEPRVPLPGSTSKTMLSRENATPNSAAIVRSKLDQEFPPEHVGKGKVRAATSMPPTRERHPKAPPSTTPAATRVRLSPAVSPA